MSTPERRTSEKFDIGLAIRREVAGDAYVDQALANAELARQNLRYGYMQRRSTIVAEPVTEHHERTGPGSYLGSPGCARYLALLD